MMHALASIRVIALCARRPDWQKMIANFYYLPSFDEMFPPRYISIVIDYARRLRAAGGDKKPIMTGLTLFDAFTRFN